MPDITFTCPFCEQHIEAPEELAGSKSECPTCQCEIHIPEKKIEPKPADPSPVPTPPTAPVDSAPTSGSGVRQPGATTRFVAAKCPSCGGDLQIPDDRDQVKCMYCGGSVITQQAIQLASGVNVANLMELAKAAAIANNSKEAYDYYTKVLEYDPRNPDAWAGKGEAAGWMSTIKDIRTTEMIAGFNNAIKFAADSDKQAMRKHCANVTNTVTSACYSIARKHVQEFVRLDNTWKNYLDQCTILMSALEAGHAYDPNNTTTIENIIHICADNIQGISFRHFDGEAGAVWVSAEYETSLRAKIDKYTTKRKQFDPGFAKPQVQKVSADPCFVATATLGDFNHPAVAELRYFRDAWLTKRRAGRLMVGCYYRIGPYAARIIRASWVLQRVSYFLIVRPALQVARRLLKHAITES